MQISLFRHSFQFIVGNPSARKINPVYFTFFENKHIIENDGILIRDQPTVVERSTGARDYLLGYNNTNNPTMLLLRLIFKRYSAETDTKTKILNTYEFMLDVDVT